MLDGAEAARVLDLLRSDAAQTYGHYTEMLNEDAEGAPLDPSRQGLARELARMNLTLNTYTQWYWKTDLQNLLHFLALRADSHAQYEIRAYAEAMLRTVAAWVPMAFEAFRDYRMGAVALSAQMLDVVRRMVAGEAVSPEGERPFQARVAGADGDARAARWLKRRHARRAPGDLLPPPGAAVAAPGAREGLLLQRVPLGSGGGAGGGSRGRAAPGPRDVRRGGGPARRRGRARFPSRPLDGLRPYSTTIRGPGDASAAPAPCSFSQSRAAMRR